MSQLRTIRVFIRLYLWIWVRHDCRVENTGSEIEEQSILTYGLRLNQVCEAIMPVWIEKGALCTNLARDFQMHCHKLETRICFCTQPARLHHSLTAARNSYRIRHRDRRPPSLLRGILDNTSIWHLCNSTLSQILPHLGVSRVSSTSILQRAL